MTSRPAHLHLLSPFCVSSGIRASSCSRSPHNKSSQGSEVPKCDRGCQCFNQTQLIWVIRPNSHCRNQRWSRTFPVGNMPCSCISPVICKTAAVREVVLLNCIVHLTSGLLGVQHTRVGFGCACQVDAVAPPSISSQKSSDIMSSRALTVSRTSHASASWAWNGPTIVAENVWYVRHASIHPHHQAGFT